jgi:hypothetical protein
MLTTPLSVPTHLIRSDLMPQLSDDPEGLLLGHKNMRGTVPTCHTLPQLIHELTMSSHKRNESPIPEITEMANTELLHSSLLYCQESREVDGRGKLPQPKQHLRKNFTYKQ